MNTTPNAQRDAFPGSSEQSDGLTKREYFAAMAMQGLCAMPISDGQIYNIATDAVFIADATLTELAKEKK